MPTRRKLPPTAYECTRSRTCLLAPAKGARFTARARVVYMGATIGVATAEVHAHQDPRHDDADPKCIAVMQATMMGVEPRSGAAG